MHAQKDEPGAGIMPENLAERFDTIEQRHADIGNDEVRLQPGLRFHQSAPIAHRAHYLKLGAVEYALQTLQNHFVIIGE
jgi:hypothetical protein